MTASSEQSSSQPTADASETASSSIETAGSAGSRWRRWDPHIHAPGTKRNNQFADTDEGWDAYLSRLEAATPIIEVIGLTDYLSLDTYEKILTFKAAGRLPQVSTIFPNVEFRFNTGAGKAALNGHLFISPDDPDHVNRTHRFLRNLKFAAGGSSYHAAPADLMDLGRLQLQGSRSISDEQALREGINQFKVDLEQLLDVRSTDSWARENILLAVATSQNDGTSGLSEDGLTQFRRNIERNMDIMLSGRPKDRTFWLGEHPNFDVDRIEELYGRLKPCLHGCDAHDLGKVARPDQDRYCWIKGGATFEALRQTVIEPERAIVAAAPPPPSQSAHLIRGVTIEGSDWAATPHVELNPGLVCIVGEKGSGKTALADVVAAGAHALDGRISNQSFLRRARPLLIDAAVRLEWADGETTRITLSEAENSSADPRIQYLSQQFVESMCSAEGMTDELVVELERVLFEAHSPSERLGAADFVELRELRCRRGSRRRVEAEERLASAAADLTAARQQGEIIPALRAEREALALVLATDSAARDKLITQGQQGDRERLRQVTEVMITVRGKLDEARRRTAALIALQDAVKQLRDTRLPLLISQLQDEHTLAGLSTEEWQRFGLSFSGDVDEVIDRRLAAARDAEFALAGPGTPPEYEIAGNPATRDGDLATFTFDDLTAEQRRLESQIGLDRQRTQALKKIQDKIAQTQDRLRALDRRISTAQTATTTITTLTEARRVAYLEVFRALEEESTELQSLYAPLHGILDDAQGALQKLSFSVRRVVNVAVWADAGEALLDLRRVGPFRGAGALLATAEEVLVAAWQTGDADAVAAAMHEFRERYETKLLEHAPVSREDRDGFRRWGERLAEWLYGTDHITLSYSMQYDGVNIEQLSPGTRGIVLLLLYLSLDAHDDRPLVIDQPEENLDPRSIYDELVPRFRETKLRRQIIIVTHNPNLVVNADADQVIVTTGGPHRPRQLPRISYRSGGLEDAETRASVCAILEGGERAFLERARRLRLANKTDGAKS